MRAVPARVGLFLGALLAPLLLVEGALRLGLGSPLEGEAFQGEAGRLWAERRMLVPVERGGVRYLGRPHAEMHYGGVVYRHNSLGLRGPEPVVPKPPGVFRILVCGDSVVYGWGVREEDTFPRRLVSLIGDATGRTVDVVQAALPGYNSADEAALYRLLVDRLDPDLVLVGFYANDIERLGLHVGHDGVLFCDPLPTPDPWKPLLWRSRLYRWLASKALYRLRESGAWRPGEGRNRAFTEDVLKAWFADIGRRGLRAAVVFLPWLEPSEGSGRIARSGHPILAWIRWLDRLCRDERVPFLDLLDAVTGRFAAELWVDPLGRDHHPNALGHRLIAEATARFLVENGLVSGG